MSNEEQKFSDEFINAFVDDQLTPEEKAQVYARLSGNEALSRQICELRKTRDLVQLAYKEPPMPARGMATLSAGRKIGLGVAAGLALVIVGGTVGWFLHQSHAPQNIAAALEKFAGIGRRFNDLGEITTPQGARVHNAYETKNMTTNNYDNRPTIVVVRGGGNLARQLEQSTRNKNIDWNRIARLAK